MSGRDFKSLRDGDRVDALVAVLKAEVGTTKRGTTFIKFLISDANGGALLAKRWDATDAEVLEAEHILWGQAIGEINVYDGALEIKLCQPLRAMPEPTNASSYLPASPLSLTELRFRLQHFIDSVQHPQLNALLRAIFVEDSSLSVPFETWPAAETRHHAFRHGLIQHSLEVADIVDAICEKHQYWGEGRGRLSRDLAITGALLHDIGKLEEYEQDGHGVRFSASGGLLGHVMLGAVRVARKAAQVRKAVGFPNELEALVLHMITAHHGKPEFGAPKSPMTMEATLVHHADMLSTECFYFAEAQAQAPDGANLVKQWKLDERGRYVYVGEPDSLWKEPEVKEIKNHLHLQISENSTADLPVEIPATLSLPLLRLFQIEQDNNFATARLPLVGQISAGFPILDSTNIEDDVLVEATGLGLGSATYYLLRVQGDSMIGDGILEGDLIVVRHQEAAEMGDIVVACLEDEGATVKRLACHGGQIFLKASNPKYSPIIVPTPDALCIQGRVVAVAR